MTSKLFILQGLILLLISFFSISETYAARVAKVKGKKVYILTQGDDLQRGQVFYLVNKSGKRTGIVKIIKVKGKKAFAKLGRGKAKRGYDLVARSRKKRKKGQRLARTGSPKSGGPTGSYWGVLGGFSNNSADVQLIKSDGSNGDLVDLSGSGFSLKGFFDYPLLEWFWFRGMAGFEQFNVSGSNDTDNLCGGECNAEITYLTGDFWGRIPLMEGSFRPWVGAGFTILVPMSKSATALDESSITNTSVIGLGAGFDYFLDKSSFIPVTLEYGLYPSSDQVDATAIFLRAGYGMSW